MSQAEPYRPHCLKPEDWPRDCLCAWEDAFRPPGLFDEIKPATRWRRATIVKVRKGFGVYLDWLRWIGVALDEGCPGRLVTLARARDYQENLASIGCAPLTIYNRLQELHFVMRALAPDMGWSWLGHAAKRMRRRALPIRQKLPRLQPIERLKRLGFNLMMRAEQDPQLSMFKRVLMFRDGLMITLLAHRPLRLRNFAALSIGTSLILTGSGSIAFPREEMKSKRPLEIPLPDALVEPLQAYLATYRPWLLARPQASSPPDCDALWISNEGRRMADVSICTMVKRRTREAFGVDLSPHLFRDCAVTSVVRDAPASARLTRDLLGHASLDTTNKHYNQALMIDASRRHTAMMEGLLRQDPGNQA